jgi:hypothetical protein
VCLRHARVYFLHAEWNFQTHCDFDTHECDYNTHKSDFYTQIVILRLMSVITTHMSVTYSRTSWISTRCVWLAHEPTKINVRLPKNSRLGSDYSGYTTRTQKTTSVIFTSCVWCWHRACDFVTLRVILALCLWRLHDWTKEVLWIWKIRVSKKIF